MTKHIINPFQYLFTYLPLIIFLFDALYILIFETLNYTSHMTGKDKTKLESLESVSLFHRISLCNMMYKLITEVIINGIRP